jgi:DNA-binding transcriptional LysR family regulator
MQAQSWLLIEEGTNTGQQLRGWISEQGLDIEPAMQLDSFDLIIGLVALGMGVSFVPIRSLAVWGQKRSVARVPLAERFERELTVVIRKQAKTPEHLRRFVENILF